MKTFQGRHVDDIILPQPVGSTMWENIVRQRFAGNEKWNCDWPSANSDILIRDSRGAVSFRCFHLTPLCNLKLCPFFPRLRRPTALLHCHPTRLSGFSRFVFFFAPWMRSCCPANFCASFPCSRLAWCYSVLTETLTNMCLFAPTVLQDVGSSALPGCIWK